jgi:deoxycytidine triphosphate deaminase
MSIKPDWWIRERAREGMIEPFVERLQRDGVISYGLSSFGYDLRAAPEWRIFVNAFNTVVDPKSFDTSSLVEWSGETCIIPPNSFVLTRSVEYLRIPDDTMVVALGKSSYARCFTGTTRVALVDGSNPTLEEMAATSAGGELHFGYSIGPNGQMLVTHLDAPRFIGRDTVLEVVLDDGTVIEATPDHEFMLRDGSWRTAEALRPGAALMPLYRAHYRGYEMTYLPLVGTFTPTHRLADAWNVRHGIHPDTPGTHRRHVDGVRTNNNPWNLVRMEATEHLRYHNSLSYDPDFDRDAHAESIRAALARRRSDTAWSARFSATQRSKAQAYWHDPAYAPQRAKVLAVAQARFHYRNHKVAAVRQLRGEHDVYCLTVPEAGNFALSAGVFVANCGIVANVTPLEPGWEGHVTLELSNTTPLPAKVYANEGIVQLLFFQGERPEVTYRDRKGKYQGQTGVTLPRL